MSDVETFESLRPMLAAIAYRMLGTVGDVDDLLQEVYLRWRQADGDAIDAPRSWLSAVTTRLCIDQLRSARRRREEYVGPWLPEPVIESWEPGVDVRAELDESLSFAFLVLMESLSPTERAVFLLHDVLGYGFAEVATIVERQEASCRQLAVRARRRIAERRPRFEVDAERRAQLTSEFFVACRAGELERLVGLLAEDAVLYADGGGQVVSARRPIHGAERIARFLIGINSKAPAGAEVEPVRVNGRPGIVVRLQGRSRSVATLELRGEQVVRVYIVNNPDKLAHLDASR